MSLTDATGTQYSASTSRLCSDMLELLVEVAESFLQVERCRDFFKRDAQLHHRKVDFGLNPDDNRFRAPQPDDVRDIAQRARSERIQYVQRRYVHDHAARAELSDFLHQRRL